MGSALVGASLAPRRWKSAPIGLLLLFVTAYTVVFSVLSIKERAALYQFDEDLAIYDQIIWNTAHGRLFDSTLIQHATILLGSHFSPAVALFVPIYWIWSDPRVLLVGQCVLLSLVAIPLFLTASRHLGDVAALVLSSTYLIYPALHYVNLFQFHEIAMLPLPLSIAILSVERGWRKTFFVAALVSLTVKEEVAFVVFGLGLLWWLRRRDTRMAAATIALAAVAGYLTIGVILPHFNTNASGGYYYVRRYSYLGNSPVQMVITALTSPWVVVAHLATLDRLTFLAELFLPLGLVPLIGWEYIVSALPIFGYLLVAESPDQYAINRHYLSPLLPFLFVGLAIGLSRLSTAVLAARQTKVPIEPVRLPEPGLLDASSSRAAVSYLAKTEKPIRRSSAIRQSWNTAGAGAVFLVCAAATYLIGPTPLGRDYDAGAFATTDHTDQARQMMALVPQNVPVSTSRNFLSWYSERQRIYRFPDIIDADYILLDPRDLRYPAASDVDGGALAKLFVSPEYRLVANRGAIALFERGNPFTWAGNTKDVTRFGNEIELLDAKASLVTSKQQVDVSFDWRALRPMNSRYTIFVHIFGPDGEIVGQADTWPIDNLYPTDLWQPGRIVPDLHTITLRASAGPGMRVEAGLYELATGHRLPITTRGLAGGSDSIDFPVSGP